MRFLVCLLLVGCATSTNELYRELETCLNDGYVCAELQDEIQRREIAQDRREYDLRPRCPFGQVEYCDHRMRGCGARHKSPNDQYACISREDVREIWR
jgi:hypothetical protein